MKRILKKLVIIGSLFLLALAGLLIARNLDSWLIRLDLHLGLAPCAVAELASSPQRIRVAVAALSDTKKQELRSRYAWQRITSPEWYYETPEYNGIPWYTDLDNSTEFAPVLRHARSVERAGNEDKFYATATSAKWKYDLVLDDSRSILWIVRDVQPASPASNK